MKPQALLAFALLGLSAPAFADEPHAAPPTVEDPAAHSDPAAHGEDHGGGHGGHHVDFAADDDHDGTANWLDSDSEGYALMKVVQHAFNLALLGGLLFWFGRRPISDALKTRATELRKELTEAARARDEAQAKYEALAARLQGFEAEVAQMRAAAHAEAQADEAQMVARAEAEADRIAIAADRTIAEELRRARVALRNDAVAIAVRLAEANLKGQIQADDQRKLARQFLDTLSASGANTHG